MAKAVAQSSIVFEVLKKDNYEDWSEAIEAYLKAQDLWDVVISDQKPPKIEEDEDKFKAWEKKNAAALHAIKISCGRNFISKIRGIREANNAWRNLQAYFYPPLPTTMEYTINPQQGDEENVDDAYKSLSRAFSERKFSDAMELCKNNPALLKERLPDYTPLLHQLIMLVSDHREQKEVVEMLKLVHFPKEALEMRDSSDRAPLAVAIDSLGYDPHVEFNSPMIDELYSITPSYVWTMHDNKYGATLITKCFEVLEYYFAAKLLEKYPYFMFAKDVNGLSPLYVAACAPYLFDSHFVDSPIAVSPYPFEFRKFTYYLMSIFFRRHLTDLRERVQFRVIQRLSIIRKAIGDSNIKSDLLRDAFFEAIKCGNFNFIVMLISYDKNILKEVNDMSKDIYTCAIEYRQPKVFSLIFWDKKHPKDRWNYASILQDKWKNNLLHMAATWTPPNALDRISKPALLMMSEAKWFEEVTDLAGNLLIKVNIDGKIPYDLFKDSHKDLMTEAEKEMKESAASWAIVGPLVITIMFAAAFQVPGGYNQEMGFPIFLNKTWFKLYMFLVSISLFSATISVVKFLEILLSDYQEKGFLSSLRTYVRTYNVITGTLFLSLATMLVAFCLGLFLTLRGQRAIFLPMAVTATFLVGYIVCTKFPLFVKSFTFYRWNSPLFEKNIGGEVELLFKKLDQCQIVKE